LIHTLAPRIPPGTPRNVGDPGSSPAEIGSELPLIEPRPRALVIFRHFAIDFESFDILLERVCMPKDGRICERCNFLRRPAHIKLSHYSVLRALERRAFS